MLASDLISEDIIPLNTSDTGEEVLTMMNVFQIKHLPIVNNEQLLGVISEDDILTHDLHEPIGSYCLSMRKPYVVDHFNIFDIMKIIAEYGLTSVPVVDKSDNYLGTVRQDDVVKLFSTSSTFKQPGAVIFIEMNRSDYSMVEISQIIESESAAILGFFIFEHRNPQLITVLMKVNKTDVQHIVASLRRYDYGVEASFTVDVDDDDLKDRYDSFMHYLDM